MEANAQLDSRKSAFVNNQLYTGTLTISGTTTSGTNTRSFSIPLTSQVSFLDITFNGPSDTLNNPRPDNGWFTRGIIKVRGDNAGAGYTNYPTDWVINTSISSNTVTVTATWSQQFSSILTLTSTSFSYKIVDYAST